MPSIFQFGTANRPAPRDPFAITYEDDPLLAELEAERTATEASQQMTDRAVAEFDAALEADIAEIEAQADAQAAAESQAAAAADAELGEVLDSADTILTDDWSATMAEDTIAQHEAEAAGEEFLEAGVPENFEAVYAADAEAGTFADIELDNIINPLTESETTAMFEHEFGATGTAEFQARQVASGYANLAYTEAGEAPISFSEAAAARTVAAADVVTAEEAGFMGIARTGARMMRFMGPVGMVVGAAFLLDDLLSSSGGLFGFIGQEVRDRNAHNSRINARSRMVATRDTIRQMKAAYPGLINGADQAFRDHLAAGIAGYVNGNNLAEFKTDPCGHRNTGVDLPYLSSRKVRVPTPRYHLRSRTMYGSARSLRTWVLRDMRCMQKRTEV